MATAPKFEAVIDADISKFMRKAATIDKTIRDMASGVIVDIGADISGFMRRAATVESTIADIERENPTIIIDANTRDFTRATREVNNQTNKLSRRITEARIGADIGSFESRMVEVSRALAEAGETVTPRIEADITEFTRDITQVQDRMREIARSTADPQVEADIAGFMAQMAAVQSQLDIVTREHDIDIRADTGTARAKLALLMLQIRAMTGRDHVIKIRAAWANYQAVMGAMATFTRNFAEVAGMVGRGLSIMISPAIVPVLTSVVGLIGNLGPMIGTLLGSTFALATSFGAAGIGAAGFAAVAVPSIGKVIKNSTELKELEEKIAKADTWKERNKLMKEQAEILNGMSKEQATAGKALSAFKEDYAALVKDMEKPVLEVFASGLTAITGILDLARPMIENVTDSIKKMMDGLNANLKADDVKGFFKFLSDFAGPALETVGSAVGNFVVGLFNMMAAFGPLATETQNSFLTMSESFRSWSAGLSENKGFQKFSAYVSENMPKIRSIFSDAINGVIHMFAAFGDSSSTMMTKLADMMEGFLKWSQALGESQGFKNFIDYISTNGPVVLSVIGEIVDFIINLGKAAAPIGEQMLGMIDAMLNFANNMMQAHPWLGKIAIGAVVMAGAFLAALPVVVGLNALLGGFITMLILSTAKMVWAAGVQIAKWILMGVTATLNAIKVAAAWAFSTGVAMVTAVANTVISVTTILAQWLLMGIQAGLHAIRVAAAWALSTGIAMVTAVASTTVAVATVLAQWALMGIQAAIHAAKVAAAWLLTTGAAMATAVAGMIATSAVFVAKWVWMGVQALLAAARMAAAWLIAMGPVGWVIAAVVGLAAIIILNWDKISDWTQKTWSKVSEWISTKWSEIKNKTTEATSSMWNTVKDKFTSIVNSVREKMSSAKETLANKWEEAKSATATKLATLVTSVLTFFTQVVSKVREKMGEAVRVLGEKVGEMPGKVRSYVGDMLSAGADLIRGLIDGAVSMARNAVNTVKSIAGDMVDAALSFFKIKSPSRVFMEMGAYVSEGLAVGVQNKAKMAVDNVTRMASDMTNAFNPQMELANLNASANLDTSVSRADMGVVRKSFAAEIDSGEDTQPAIYVTNELVGDKILTVVNRGQAKQSRLTDGFYGK